MSGALQLFKSIRVLVKDKSQLKSSLNPDLLSIIVFLSASTLALRFVRCLLKRLRDKDDGFNSFVAGLAFGLVGTRTLNKNYWYIMLMFVASRIWGAIYQYLLQKKILDSKRQGLHYYAMFAFANSVNSYGYFIEPDILKSDMYNLYDRMAMLSNN
jgi:predicted permease